MNTAATPTALKNEAAEKVGPLSLKLTPSSRARLRNLAEIQHRPAHALARAAVEAYIEAQEEKIRRHQEAQASWQHYQDTGLHITGAEAMAWIKSWGTPNPLPKPQCHT